MLLIEEIFRIKKIMNISDNIFKNLDLSELKKMSPFDDNSIETKKEINFIKNINLNNKFILKNDDILGNFYEFLDSKNVKYDKKLLKNIIENTVIVVKDLKTHFKRKRPFKLDKTLKDPMLKSTVGYAYPSGHSTQANLLSLVLKKLYPKYKNDFQKIVDDIVYSRQMARAHYPSDVEFGEFVAKKLFKNLKDNKLID